jgi:hypothetical protein
MDLILEYISLLGLQVQSDVPRMIFPHKDNSSVYIELSGSQ